MLRPLKGGLCSEGSIFKPSGLPKPLDSEVKKMSQTLRPKPLGFAEALSHENRNSS